MTVIAVTIGCVLGVLLGRVRTFPLAAQVGLGVVSIAALALLAMGLYSDSSSMVAIGLVAVSVTPFVQSLTTRPAMHH